MVVGREEGRTDAPPGPLPMMSSSPRPPTGGISAPTAIAGASSLQEASETAPGAAPTGVDNPGPQPQTADDSKTSSQCEGPLGPPTAAAPEPDPEWGRFSDPTLKSSPTLLEELVSSEQMLPTITEGESPDSEDRAAPEVHDDVSLDSTAVSPSSTESTGDGGPDPAAPPLARPSDASTVASSAGASWAQRDLMLIAAKQQQGVQALLGGGTGTMETHSLQPPSGEGSQSTMLRPPAAALAAPPPPPTSHIGAAAPTTLKARATKPPLQTFLSHFSLMRNYAVTK